MKKKFMVNRFISLLIVAVMVLGAIPVMPLRVAASDVNPGTPAGMFFPASVSGGFYTPTATAEGLVITYAHGARNRGGVLGTSWDSLDFEFTFTGTRIDLHMERYGWDNPGITVYIAESGGAFAWRFQHPYVFDAGSVLTFDNLAPGTHTIRVQKRGMGNITFPGFTVFGTGDDNGGGTPPPIGFNPGNPTGITYVASTTMYGLNLIGTHGFAMDGNSRMRIAPAYSAYAVPYSEHTLQFGFTGTGVNLRTSTYGDHVHISTRILNPDGTLVRATEFEPGNPGWDWYRNILVSDLYSDDYILEVTFHMPGNVNFIIWDFTVFDTEDDNGGGTLPPPAGFNPGNPAGITYTAYTTMYGLNLADNHGFTMDGEGRMRLTSGYSPYAVEGSHVMHFGFIGTGVGIDVGAWEHNYDIAIRILRLDSTVVRNEVFTPADFGWSWPVAPRITDLTRGEYIMEVTINAAYPPNMVIISFVVFDTGDDNGGGTPPDHFFPGDETGIQTRFAEGMPGLDHSGAHVWTANGYQFRLTETRSHTLLLPIIGTGVQVTGRAYSGYNPITVTVRPAAGGAPVATEHFAGDITGPWFFNFEVMGFTRGYHIVEIYFHYSDSNLILDYFIIFDTEDDNGGGTGPSHFNPGSLAGIQYPILSALPLMPGLAISPMENFAFSWDPGYSRLRSVGTFPENAVLEFNFIGTGVSFTRNAWAGNGWGTDGGYAQHSPITIEVFRYSDNMLVHTSHYTEVWEPWNFTVGVQDLPRTAYTLVVTNHTANLDVNHRFYRFTVYDTGPGAGHLNPGTIDGINYYVRGGDIPGLRLTGGWWAEDQNALRLGPLSHLPPGPNSMRITGVANTPAYFEFDFFGTGVEVGVSSFQFGATIDLNIIPFGGSASDVVATHRHYVGFGFLADIETVANLAMMDLPLGAYTVRAVVNPHPDNVAVNVNFALLYFTVWDESEIRDPRVVIVTQPLDIQMAMGVQREIFVEAGFRNVPDGSGTFRYQWYTINADGSNQQPIAGATSSALNLSDFTGGDHFVVAVVSCGDDVTGGPALPAITRIVSIRIFSAEAGRTFHVSAAGNDAWDGLTPETAWRTVGRVAGYNPHMRPGDSILFRRGDVWVNGDIQGNGSTFLNINQGGVRGAVLTIGAFGDPNLPKPILNGSGRHNTIMLNNVEYVRIENLRIMNNSVTDGIMQRDRRGIFVGAWNQVFSEGDRWLRGLEFIDLEITAIDGWVRHVIHMNDTDRMDPRLNTHGHPMSVMGGISGHWWNNAVIEFNAGGIAGFRDILIEGCYFFDFGSYGIRSAGNEIMHWYEDGIHRRGYIENFWIRNSVMRNTGQDSFNVYGGSAEFNAFYDNAKYYITRPQALGGPQWEWTGIAYVSDGSIHQFNEYTRAWYDGDSMSLDSDIGAVGTVLIQYNLSHDMDGGFWMQWPTAQCRQVGAYTDGPDMDAVIIRYNVIVNDGGYWGYAIPGARSGNMHVFKMGDSNALVYNNTVFKNNGFWIGIQNEMPRVGHPTSDFGERKPAGSAAYFFNNLFVADNVGDLTGTTYTGHWGTFTIPTAPTFYDLAGNTTSGYRMVAVENRIRPAEWGNVGGRSQGEIIFNNNAFWSNRDIPIGVDDPNAIVADPMFVGLDGDGLMPAAAGFSTSKWNDLDPNDRTLSINRTLVNVMGTDAITTRGNGDAVIDALRYLASPFMLQEGSPMQGMGIEITEEFALSLLPNMRVDLFRFNNDICFFGNERVVGAAPTIGAHELGALDVERAATPELELIPEDKTAIRIANYADFAGAPYGIEFRITPGSDEWIVYNHSTGIAGLIAITEYSIVVRHINDPDFIQSFASDPIETERRGLSSSLPMNQEDLPPTAGVHSFYGVGFEVTVSAPGTLIITMGGYTVTVDAVPGAVYYFDIPGVEENGMQSITIAGTATVSSVIGYSLMIPPTPVLEIDPRNPQRASIANIADYETRFGPLQVSLNDGEWFNYTGLITGMPFGTNNSIRVRFAGTDFYIASVESLPSEIHNPQYPENALPVPYGDGLPPAPITLLSAVRGPGDGWTDYNYIIPHWVSEIGPRGGYGHGIIGADYTVHFRGTAIEAMAHMQNTHARFVVFLNGEMVGYYDLARMGAQSGYGAIRRLNFRICGLEYGDHVLDVFMIGGTWRQLNAIVIYGREIVPVPPVLDTVSGVTRIANLEVYELQSRHTDLDGTVEWVFGQLEVSINGGEWMLYDDAAGFTLADPSNDEVRVRYAGTNRDLGDHLEYRFANFTPSQPSLPAGTEITCPGCNDAGDACCAECGFWYENCAVEGCPNPHCQYLAWLEEIRLAQEAYLAYRAWREEVRLAQEAYEAYRAWLEEIRLAEEAHQAYLDWLEEMRLAQEAYEAWRQWLCDTGQCGGCHLCD